MAYVLYESGLSNQKKRDVTPSGTKAKPRGRVQLSEGQGSPEELGGAGFKGSSARSQG